MAKVPNFRSIWEWVGHIHVATWLFEITHASAVLAVIVAAVAAYWAFVTQWGYLPVALTFLGVFVALIWGINGILWMQGRRRPSRARITFDYSYALHLERLDPSFDPRNVANTFEVRAIIRNHANGPAKIVVERFRITIQDRFFECPTTITHILPRGGDTMIFPGGGFDKEAFDSFKKYPSLGTIELAIKYGHPEDQLSRLWEKKIRLLVFKIKDENDNIRSVNITWTIIEETDSTI